MQGTLNKNQLQYVLFHLSFLVEDFDKIQPFFKFITSVNEVDKNEKHIYFILSDQPLKDNNITYYNDIPILFPISKSSDLFSLNKALVFNHDILKSAFYLLSGFQEYHTAKIDNMGRFPYKSSVQYKLKIIEKPIVNYYFEIILEGIEKFCNIHSIPFKRKNLFGNFTIMLTHDIDRIKTYTVTEIFYRLKQSFGLTKAQYKRRHVLKLFFRSILSFLYRKKNPHWDFDKIRQYEKNHGYNSVFYFLYNEKKNYDSDYTYDLPKITELFKELDADNCEIGIHGTCNSVDNEASMKKIYHELSQYSPQEPIGIRQHRLLFNNPKTIKTQESVNAKYDTSLGFAEHEGFRNSYCLPFRLYDFENDRMSRIWEIPLIAMDVSLFHYRSLSIKEAQKTIKELILEIKKFNGIFTLLWHNGFGFDDPDQEIPNSYPLILDIFKEHDAISLTGKEIINHIENEST